MLVSIKIIFSEGLIQKIEKGTIRKIRVNACSTSKRNVVANVLEA